jgi:hypothetical protein
MVLDRVRTAGIMQQGGTILGTTNRGGKFGAMVSYQNYEVSDAPMADAVHCLRLVATDHQLVKTTREVGISFGDIGAEIEAACLLT